MSDVRGVPTFRDNGPLRNSATLGQSAIADGRVFLSCGAMALGRKKGSPTKPDERPFCFGDVMIVKSYGILRLRTFRDVLIFRDCKLAPKPAASTSSATPAQDIAVAGASIPTLYPGASTQGKSVGNSIRSCALMRKKERASWLPNPQQNSRRPRRLPSRRRRRRSSIRPRRTSTFPIRARPRPIPRPSSQSSDHGRSPCGHQSRNPPRGP